MTPPGRASSSDFSSPVAAALQHFLDFKRAAGCRYRGEARALGELDRFLAQHLVPSDPVISLEILRAYVARRDQESETTRAHRVSLIRQVCRFLALEQPRTAIPGPRFLGICRRPFVPRVLTREEGRRFLQACITLPAGRCSPLRGTILGTTLVLLYLTGLRAGEALRLTDADVDLDAAVLRVRHTKFAGPGWSRWRRMSRAGCATPRGCRPSGRLAHRPPRSFLRPLAAATPSPPCVRPSMPWSPPPTSRGGAVAARFGCTKPATRSPCSASCCGASRTPISAPVCRRWPPTWGTSASIARSAICR